MPHPARFALAFALASAALASPLVASADVIMEMPIDCPRGTTKGVSHDGPYCVPPLRADCPPGYEPRVRHSTAYCEAPPPAPCPKGMYWESSGPNTASCTLDDSCDKLGEECFGGGKCENLSFCLEEKDMGRYTTKVARGTCTTQADCKAFPESKCEKRLTCTNPEARKHEAQRIAAAKDVPASAVPAPYEASSFQGAPPRYPILKDGQKLPPLPDVPEPPDDAPDASPETTDAPDSGPAAHPAPTTEPPISTSNAPKSTSGRGGCAGCKVGTSDRDMAGWAALMSLIGLGIVVRRRLR